MGNATKLRLDGQRVVNDAASDPRERVVAVRIDGDLSIEGRVVNEAALDLSKRVVASRIGGGRWADPFGGVFTPEQIADFDALVEATQKVRITDEDGETDECTLVEFLDANASTLDDEEIRSLKAGDR